MLKQWYLLAFGLFFQAPVAFGICEYSDSKLSVFLTFKLEKEIMYLPEVGWVVGGQGGGSVVLRDAESAPRCQ